MNEYPPNLPSTEEPPYPPAPPPDGIQTARPQRVAVRLPKIKPWACYSLMAFTLVCFILQMLGKYLLGEVASGVGILEIYGMKINSAILAGQVWRLITPVFLHGSIPHFVLNMYALYMIGRNLERHYGHKRFLLLYFLSAITGNLASFWFSEAASLGASTAIFGLVAAEAIFIYRNRFLFGSKYQSMIVNVIAVVVINLALGFSPGIDNWGHMGGLVGGLAFAWFAGPLAAVHQQVDGFYLIDQRSRKQIGVTVLAESATLVVLTIARFLRN